MSTLLQNSHSQILTPYNGKNWVINSNFDFWPLGTSFTQATLATGKYHADYWLTQWDGTTTFTISQQAFAVGQSVVPNNPTYYTQANITAASGATVFNIMQRVEDVTKSSGKTFTISFWAMADAARTVTMDCEQVFGTGGSPSSTVSIGTVGTFAVTTSWQQFSTTVTFPSVSGKTLGTNNDHYFNFDFDLPINTVCTLNIAQVMMNEGVVAAPYSMAGNDQSIIVEYSDSSGAGYGASTTFNAITMNTKEIDPRSAFNGTTGVFTAPVSGTYLAKVLLAPYATLAGANLYSSITSSAGPVSTMSNNFIGGSAIFSQINMKQFKLLAGQTLTFTKRADYGSGTVTLANIAAFNSISIVRVGN